ncbi:MAG: type IV secretion system DNA-binding domain-containing protein [Succinivibrio sp.]
MKSLFVSVKEYLKLDGLLITLFIIISALAFILSLDDLVKGYSVLNLVVCGISLSALMLIVAVASKTTCFSFHRKSHEFLHADLANLGDLLAQNTKAKSGRSPVFIGYGFEFKPSHTRKLYALLENGLEGSSGTGHGSYDLNNLGTSKPLFSDVYDLTGHTMIFGTTGAGKTRFLDLLISQAILRGDVVIVIDPKGDTGLKKGIKRSAAFARREHQYHEIDLIRLDLNPHFNLMGSASSPTQMADRLTSLIPGGSGGEFKGFAREAVNYAVIALNFMKKPVTVASIANAISLEQYVVASLEFLIELVTAFDDKRLLDYLNRLLKGFGFKSEDYPKFHLALIIKGLVKADGRYLVYIERVREELQKEKINALKEQGRYLPSSLYQESDLDESKEEIFKVLKSRLASYDFSFSNSSKTYLQTDHLLEVLSDHQQDNPATNQLDAKTDHFVAHQADLKADCFSCLQNDPFDDYLEELTVSDKDTEFESEISSTARTTKRTSSKSTSAKSRSSTVKSASATKRKAASKKIPPSSMALRLLEFYRYGIKQGLAYHEDLMMLLNFAIKDESYFLKVTNSIRPVLTALSVSKRAETFSDPEAMSVKGLYLHDSIFYVALQSMKDETFCEYVGKLLLSDLASLSGDIYNGEYEGVLKGGLSKRVSIFIDEVGEVANKALIQLLNKSRGSKFAITLAAQTFSDIKTRTGSNDMAHQVIGNCNTVFSMRVVEDETAALVVESLVETTITDKGESSSKSRNLKGGSTVSGFSKNYKNVRVPLFPRQALTQLPDLEYVGRLSDGRFVKGVIPFLQVNE